MLLSYVCYRPLAICYICYMLYLLYAICYTIDHSAICYICYWQSDHPWKRQEIVFYHIHLHLQLGTTLQLRQETRSYNNTCARNQCYFHAPSMQPSDATNRLLIKARNCEQWKVNKKNRSQSKKIRNTVSLARTTKLAIMHLKKTTLHTTTIHIAPAFRCLKVTCTEH